MVKSHSSIPFVFGDSKNFLKLNASRRGKRGSHFFPLLIIILEPGKTIMNCEAFVIKEKKGKWHKVLG